MKEILYIGPHNPREKLNIKERYVKDLIKTGLYEEVDNNVFKQNKTELKKLKDLKKLNRDEQEEILDNKNVDYSYKDNENDLIEKIIES